MSFEPYRVTVRMPEMKEYPGVDNVVTIKDITANSPAQAIQSVLSVEKKLTIADIIRVEKEEPYTGISRLR